MKNSKRALRRQSEARMKQKARKLYPNDHKATMANHLAGCSCPMCGNPRKWFGAVTIQERKQRVRADVDLDNLPKQVLRKPKRSQNKKMF